MYNWKPGCWSLNRGVSGISDATLSHKSVTSWFTLRYGDAVRNALGSNYTGSEGDLEMQRFALGLLATSACFFAFDLAMVLPSRVMAFDMETGAVIAPGGSTQFQDPDEKLLPAPLTLPGLEEN